MTSNRRLMKLTLIVLVAGMLLSVSHANSSIAGLPTHAQIAASGRNCKAHFIKAGLWDVGSISVRRMTCSSAVKILKTKDWGIFTGRSLHGWKCTVGYDGGSARCTQRTRVIRWSFVSAETWR